jgi:molybdopterin/thiamine biosynthesis adenylyltransferase
MLHVRLTEPLYEAVSAYLLPMDDLRERICFTFGQQFRQGDDLYFLFAEEPLLLDEDCYLSRTMGNARLPKEVMDGVLLQFAGGSSGVLGNWHSHGFSRRGTRFSSVDDQDDRQLATWLAGPFSAMLAEHPRIGIQRKLSSLAFVMDHGGLAARLVLPDGRFVPVNTVDIVGSHLRRLHPYNAPKRSLLEVSDSQDRHRDFLSDNILRELGGMRIGLVGAGGVGCLLSEGLARLGVGELLIADQDKLDRSNLNRWLGAMPSMVGEYKARLLAARLSVQVPHCCVKALCQPLEQSLDVLRTCDVLVTAVDNDFARFQANRLATQYLIPWFDSGTVILAGDDTLDFRHRVLSVYPGATACIECTAFSVLSGEDVLLEMADEALRSGRKEAGYVMDRPEVRSPSVIGLNFTVAGELLTEFINYLAASRPAATQIYARWRDNFRQRVAPDGYKDLPQAHCPACGLRLGAAESEGLPRSGRARQDIAKELSAWREARHHKLAERMEQAAGAAY